MRIDKSRHITTIYQDDWMGDAGHWLAIVTAEPTDTEDPPSVSIDTIRDLGELTVDEAIAIGQALLDAARVAVEDSE